MYLYLYLYNTPAAAFLIRAATSPSRLERKSGYPSLPPEFNSDLLIMFMYCTYIPLCISRTSTKKKFFFLCVILIPLMEGTVKLTLSGIEAYKTNPLHFSCNVSSIHLYWSGNPDRGGFNYLSLSCKTRNQPADFAGRAEASIPFPCPNVHLNQPAPICSPARTRDSAGEQAVPNMHIYINIFFLHTCGKAID